MLVLLDRLLFLLSETTVGLRRNGMMTIAALSTAAVSLTQLGGFFLITYGLQKAAATLPEKFEIRAVMARNATSDQIKTVEAKIKAIPGAYEVRHNTKEQNWKYWKEKYKSETGDLSDLDSVVPVSDDFFFKLPQLDQTSTVAETLRTLPGVERVRHLKDEERAVMGLIRFINIVGISASIALLCAAAVLIYNAIRLTVMARQKEIRIMQLVGATPVSIRFPFVMEGLAHGITGAVVAWGILWLGAHRLAVISQQLFSVSFSWNFNQSVLFLTMLVLCGAFLGTTGGLVAVRRFLKV